MELLRIQHYPVDSVFLPKTGDTYALFKTCLRNLVIGFGEFSEVSTEAPLATYSGKAAYAFMLQILTGLESPVLGETEVLGQFKTQLRDFPKEIAVQFQGLLADVKYLRAKFLTHTGGATYGSFTREYLAEAGSVVFVGAGQLTQEIYPWIAKSDRSIFIAVRSQKKIEISLKPETRVELLSNLTNLNVSLVIAASISSTELLKWIEQNKIKVQLCVDFRTNNQKLGPNWLCLNEIFDQMNANRQDRQRIKQEVLNEIAKLIELRSEQAENRPLGWEDLCG